MFGTSDKGKSQGLAHTLISRQTEIRGDLRFSGELIIEGKVCGNVYADDESGALVRVAETGVIEGEIWVPSAVINGLVKGDVHCSKHLEVAAKAVIMGNVFYSLIEMVMGSEVNGKLMHIARMQHDAKLLAAQSKVLGYEAETYEKSIHNDAAGHETVVD